VEDQFIQGRRKVEEENLYLKPKLATVESPSSAKQGAGTGRDVFDFFVDYFCKDKPVLLKNLMDRLERGIICRVLWTTEGNQKRAAEILGIKYTTLNEKVKKYGIRFQKTPVDFMF
jgi:DNA-binding protein Fis